MSHSKRTFLPVLVLVISVVLVGCAKGPEEQASEKGALKDTGIKVKVHMEDEQGKKTTIEGYGKVAIPPEFPKDIMIYPGAEVREAIMAESGDGCFVRLEAREPCDRILGAYKEKMKADGWKETAASTTGAISQREYAKNNRTVSLAVTDMGGGRTEIQMSLRVNRTP
jgi:hypothetical protein